MPITSDQHSAYRVSPSRRLPWLDNGASAEPAQTAFTLSVREEESHEHGQMLEGEMKGDEGR
jgi:hypothetical protein